MSALEALILGLIQGLTEFLPVSSSGHIAIGKEVLGVEASGDLVLELVLHCATVLATIVVFRKQIWSLIRQLFRFQYNDGTDYILKIAVSMIPVFIVGVFFKDVVEAMFASFYVVGIALLLTSFLLFFSDRKSKRVTTSNVTARNGISWWQAFVVGLGQAFAVIPGLSRSGTTISTGLISGIRREDMAQFSFLMVLIPILGETFLELVRGELVSSSVGAWPLLVGFVSAFVSGLFACRAMIALVKKASLKWFALYCAIAGAVVLIYCIL